MKRRGVVVAVSGVDCAGKSTQSELLDAYLREVGYEPRRCWTRAGYTPGFKALKAANRFVRGTRKRGKSPDDTVSEKPSRYPRRAENLGPPWRRRVWLACALLDLLWVYGMRLRLWKAAGRAVLCDRYLLDCLVDFRVNFPDDRVEGWVLCRLLRRVAVQPDYALCMLVPPEQTVDRSRRKGRFHWETVDVLQRRHDEYRRLAGELDVVVFDGTSPRGDLARAITARVSDVLQVPLRHSVSC